MASLTESYFYTVPEDEVPDIPDFEGFLNKMSSDINYSKLFKNGQYAPVMSLTVIREHEDGLQVLSGPRGETNGTHIDVVSVPTMRLAKMLATAALGNSIVESRTATELMLVRQWYRYDGVDALESDALGSMVIATMAQKVGLADLVALSPDKISISLESLTLGMSLVEADPITKTKTVEAIAMLNAAVVVPADTAAPDPSPAAYTALKWFGLKDFQDGYHRRDAVGMFPEIATYAVGMCVHGVCMATTSRVLQRGLTMPSDADTVVVCYLPEGTMPYECAG